MEGAYLRVNLAGDALQQLVRRPGARRLDFDGAGRPEAHRAYWTALAEAVELWLRKRVEYGFA